MDMGSHLRLGARVLNIFEKQCFGSKRHLSEIVLTISLFVEVVKYQLSVHYISLQFCSLWRLMKAFSFEIFIVIKRRLKKNWVCPTCITSRCSWAILKLIKSFAAGGILMSLGFKNNFHYFVMIVCLDTNFSLEVACFVLLTSDERTGIYRVAYQGILKTATIFVQFLTQT